VAQQDTHVYYTLYACQIKEHLNGWAVVHKVSSHSRLPVPNDEDYNFNTNTYDGEFYQEEGIQGRFKIDLTEAIGMVVDNNRINDKDNRDHMQNVKDLQMLERLCLGNDNKDNIPSLDSVDYFDMVDSDDETYDPANPDHEDYF